MSLLALASPAARSADAEALRVRSAVPGDAAAAAGAHSASRSPSFPHVARARRHPRERRRDARRRCASSRARDTPVPEVQLLSNGRYHVMVTNAGGGSSRWNDLAVTRWREDAHLRQLGHVLLPPRRRERRVLVDRASADGASRPTTTRRSSRRGAPNSAAATTGSTSHTEIAVSPEDDIELRRTRIVNRSRARKVIEVTSYAEVVLAAAGGGRHASGVLATCSCRPKSRAREQAILCTRRPRSPDEHAPWMFHLMAVHGAKRRRRVLRDRPHALRRPRQHARRRRTRCVDRGAALRQRGLGARSDRRRSAIRITLEPEQTVTIDMVYGVAETRDAAIALVDKYQDPRLADRVVELAWTHAQVVLRQINATEADARLYARLANSIIFANASLRADAGVIARNRRGQSGLWGYAISGDLPIVLLRIADAGQHRSRAPARAGARVLAPQGPRRRSRDLERGSRGIPAAAAGADHGTRRGAASRRSS